MADPMKDVIAQLERQRSAIEKALAALKAVEQTGHETAMVSAAGAPATGRRRGRPPKRKGGMTPEGRQRLAEAMRRRWAIKRSAAQAKKRGRKKKR